MLAIRQRGLGSGEPLVDVDFAAVVTNPYSSGSYTVPAPTAPPSGGTSFNPAAMMNPFIGIGTSLLNFIGGQRANNAAAAAAAQAAIARSNAAEPFDWVTVIALLGLGVGGIVLLRSL